MTCAQWKRLITLPYYTSGFEPDFFSLNQFATLPKPHDLSSLTLLLEQIKAIDPNTSPGRIEFLDVDMEVIPKDTLIEKVMEWVNYENQTYCSFAAGGGSS